MAVLRTRSQERQVLELSLLGRCVQKSYCLPYREDTGETLRFSKETIDDDAQVVEKTVIDDFRRKNHRVRRL